jgi:hypothetical protein
MIKRSNFLRILLCAPSGRLSVRGDIEFRLVLEGFPQYVYFLDQVSRNSSSLERFQQYQFILKIYSIPHIYNIEASGIDVRTLG